MPTLHHQNSEQNLPYAPPNYAASFRDDQSQEAANAWATEQQVVTRPISRRYKVTWAGVVSAVKWSDVLVVTFGSLLMVGIGVAVAAMLGKPFFFASEVIGTILFVTVLQIKENHQARFTGKRPLLWLISWLFLATLWFAFFALLRVMRHRNLVVLDEIFAASIFATGSIVWQYWQQSRRAAKAH